MSIVRYTYPIVSRFSPALGLGVRSPWTGLEREIDRMLSVGFGFAPQMPVDVYEDGDNTYVRAEIPGVSRNDVDVQIAEGDLTISATRKTKEGENEESSSFSRSIALPHEVQADKVAAAYENGVLTVTLPKREESKPKKITVAVS